MSVSSLLAVYPTDGLLEDTTFTLPAQGQNNVSFNCNVTVAPATVILIGMNVNRNWFPLTTLNFAAVGRYSQNVPLNGAYLWVCGQLTAGTVNTICIDTTNNVYPSRYVGARF